jgi:hypothetical protein
MKYMIMFKTTDDAEGIPPCKDEAEMVSFIGQLAAEGVLLGTEGLYPSERGARVTRVAGKVAAMDGPFTEAKELVAGFVLVKVGSRAEAVDLAGRFLEVAGQGTAEVREVIESPQDAARYMAERFGAGAASA